MELALVQLFLIAVIISTLLADHSMQLLRQKIMCTAHKNGKRPRIRAFNKAHSSLNLQAPVNGIATKYIRHTITLAIGET